MTQHSSLQHLSRCGEGGNMPRLRGDITPKNISSCYQMHMRNTEETKGERVLQED